jgi:exodeoxyribonuclease VII small subunit
MPARFEAIGLISSDLARSAAFYRLLGVDLPAGDDHLSADLPGGIRLMLDTPEVIRSFDPGWDWPTGAHRSSLAFRCDSPAEVDATFRDLLAAGGSGHKEPWDAFWGQRYAQVKDPDGTSWTCSRTSPRGRSAILVPVAESETSIEQLPFDDALAELQRTVAELEAGGLPLERSIALYERGVALHERCAKLLGEAELKIQQLVTRAGGALEAIDVAPDEAREAE